MAGAGDFVAVMVPDLSPNVVGREVKVLKGSVQGVDTCCKEKIGVYSFGLITGFLRKSELA